MIRRAGLTLCCLLAGGTAFAQSRVPTHVACVGDSITYGYDASSPSASYPSDLQRMFGSSVQVGNYGHSGATMLSTGDLPYRQQSEYTGATTFVSGAGASAVVDVVIMLGTNDTKSYNWMTSSGTRAQQFQTDCGAMVDHFAQLSTHPQVFLALPPEIYANAYGIDQATLDDQIIPIIKQVAAAKHVPVIDVNTPTKGHSELFSDGVHPTDTGYMLVAQIIHDGLLAAPGGAGGAGGAGTGGAGGGGRGGAGGGGHAGAGGGSGKGGGAGGSPGAGGAAGAAATGGASGGTIGSTGGVTAGSGGSPGTGGAAISTGGSVGSGGSPATGGAPGAGGSPTGGGTGQGSTGCSCQLGGPPLPAEIVFVVPLALFVMARRPRRGRGMGRTCRSPAGRRRWTSRPPARCSCK